MIAVDDVIDVLHQSVCSCLDKLGYHFDYGGVENPTTVLMKQFHIHWKSDITQQIPKKQVESFMTQWQTWIVGELSDRPVIVSLEVEGPVEVKNFVCFLNKKEHSHLQWIITVTTTSS